MQTEKDIKRQRISSVVIPFTGYWMSPLRLLPGQRVKMAVNMLSNQLQKSILGSEETQGDVYSLHPPPRMAYNFLMLAKDIFSLPSGTVRKANKTGSRD